MRELLDAIRRNHALEHATVAVLLARGGPRRIAGLALPDGFLVAGDAGAPELEACAIEALRLLREGHEGLAVSPLCGSNVVAASALAALGATLARGRGLGRLPNAFLAAAIGAVAGQPAGRLVQRRITTLADHAEVEVLGVTPLAGRLHKVATRRVPLSRAADGARP